MWTFIVNLDYDYVLDRIIYSSMYDFPETVTVYDADGIFIDDFIVPGDDGTIAGMDTDENGDIWLIYHTPAGLTGSNTLYHYEYDESGGEYTMAIDDLLDLLDVTFIENGTRGIYDLAVMPSKQRLYVLHADGYPYRGAVYVFDYSQTPPVHLSDVTRQGMFNWTGNTGASISDYGKWEGCSIDSY